MRDGLRYLIARADALVNRLYTWRMNPLYQSGSIVVVTFVIMLVTGLYLVCFYRIGTPYESVAGINGQVVAGRWIRALHRYAADAAVVAAAIHALRMFVQKRTWGPRALAWISGLVLLFLIYVCGWTGYVMVWDSQAQLLAAEGARWLDALPLFSVPVQRTFQEQSLPAAFFFLNLFLHIALPIGLAMLLWLHVSRVARPVLLPPKALTVGIGGLLFAASLLWPAPLDPEANAVTLPGRVAVDVFYNFWLPFSPAIPASVVWAGIAGLSVALLSVPFLTRPSPARRPEASVVAERLCTGCEQCYVDCPYDAISMLARTDGRDGLVARVDPSRCVSCGICTGSCAPMGVGPPLRAGRDQLQDVKEYIARHAPGESDIVVIACQQGAVRGTASPADERTPPFRISCAGNLHTSVIEYLVRSGAGGVFISACPPRDCWNREGPIWMEQRVFHDREAELQARVDKDRVRVGYHAEAEGRVLVSDLKAFREHMRSLDRAEAEADIEIGAECEVPVESES